MAEGRSAPINRIPAWPVSSLAVALLLLSGIGYRETSAHLAQVSGTHHVPRGTLSVLSLTIGDWTGRDVPLDERVVKATDTDDHIHRVYQSPSGKSVTLYLAMGVRMRDLMPHRPEVCYPSAGWIFERKRPVEPIMPNGAPRPVHLIRFRPGGLETGSLTILNYYVIDGRHCPDVSMLRSQSWRVGGAGRYAAQVQVAASSGPLLADADAENLVLDFFKVAGPQIELLLEEAVAPEPEADKEIIR